MYALCCSCLEAAAVAASVGARPGAPPTVPGGPLIAVATSTHGLVEGELMPVEEMAAASEASSGVCGGVGGGVCVGGGDKELCGHVKRNNDVVWCGVMWWY